MSQSLDVAIIGAGIAGNALAKSMADQGWETVLFERKAFPRHKVCGEFLSPESLGMLNALGVSKLIETLQPSLIDRTRLVFGHGEALEIPLPGTALGISRYSLDSALLHAARSSGVQALTATSVTAVTPNNGRYILETKQGNQTITYEARVVVAAWGANGHSGVAVQCPNLPIRPNRLSIKNSYLGIKSHFKGIELEPVVELYFFDGGYLGISSIEGGMINVAALLKRSAFPNTPKTILGWIEAACSRNPELQHKLANAVPVAGSEAAVAPVLLNRKPLAWDLFPHIGDAALMIPPLCGDGMSIALRSAQLCAPLAHSYLKREITLAAWQHKYSQLVKQQFNGPRQWGRLLQWLASKPLMPGLLLRAARFKPELAYRLVQATRLKD